jgi:aminoglycoside 6-adenylyltransferase
MPDEVEMIQRFVAWGESRSTVRAMLLTSSRAAPLGTVDLFSDYDLILILTDIIPYYQDRDWLADFGPMLVHYRDPISRDGDFETSIYVTQYENGLKIDFSLWPVGLLKRIAGSGELPEEFEAGYRVLLDKDDLTQGLPPPSYQGYIPARPTEIEYREKIEGFFLDATYAAKFLWREDLIAAKHQLDHFIKQDYLIPVLVWRMEIDQDWSLKPGLYGQRLKRWLAPDLWAELEKTFTGLNVEANWEALTCSVELFRRAAGEVGQALGYPYPEDLDRRTVAYLRRIRELDRDAPAFPSDEVHP